MGSGAKVFGWLSAAGLLARLARQRYIVELALRSSGLLPLHGTPREAGVPSLMMRGEAMRIPMKTTARWTALLVATVMLIWATSLVTGPDRSTSPVLAAELQIIQLPKPVITGGIPLMQALAARRTTRAFMDKPLPLQALSNLLWAAFGVNRPRAVKSDLGRTAPSAYNKQDITLEVVLADGVYVYDAEQSLLRPVLSGDVRGAISPAPAAHAAVTIIYVAPVKDDYAQVDVGFIAQNVYLFAASEGLNAWFYTVHAQDVAAKLGLGSDRSVLYAQSVGYPLP
jgi:nitroreductase